MAEYTPKERLARALRGEPVDRMPAVSFTQTGTVEQMDACGAAWPEANDDAQKMATLAEAAHTELGFEAVRVPFDISAEAEFFGCGIKAGTKEQQPSVNSHVVKSVEDVEARKGFDINTGRVATVCEAVKILADKYGDELPIMGSMLGPFSLAQHMVGDDWFMAIMTEPDFAQAVMDLALDFNIQYANKMADNGADTMVIIDPTASAMLIGDEYFKQLVVPAHKAIVEAMTERGVLSIVHICGDTTLSLGLMEESGCAAISVDQTVDIATAKTKVNSARIVGNIDPVAVLWKGSPEKVAEVTQKAIDDGVDIIAPGCGIVSKSPSANLKAMADTAKNHTY